MSAAGLSPMRIEASLRFAMALLDRLRESTAADVGVEREPYGEGERIAHEIAAVAATRIGLEVRHDAAGNLYMTLPGRERGRPAWVIGSHLDSVPAGGNFDGAAGVVAGLAVAHAFVANGWRADGDLIIVAMRAEEASSWFSGPHGSHFGSRAMFGQLGLEELESARSLRSGRTLSASIAAAGFSPEDIALGRWLADPREMAGYLELHIEQGPVLVERDRPVGLVTGIRGNLRARNCLVVGEHAHSGAVPKEYRKDAVFAAAEFATALEARWEQWLASGRDAVCTLGIFSTDPLSHSISKVPGHLGFTIDIRSIEADLLREAEGCVTRLAAEISARRGVQIDLGRLSRTEPTVMSADVLERLALAADEIGQPVVRLASGGGHDAVSFANAGVPSGMIFVRSKNGSHNPQESMEEEDFAAGLRLMVAFLAPTAIRSST